MTDIVTLHKNIILYEQNNYFSNSYKLKFSILFVRITIAVPCDDVVLSCLVRISISLLRNNSSSSSNKQSCKAKGLLTDLIIIIIIFVYFRLTHATAGFSQKSLASVLKRRWEQHLSKRPLKVFTESPHIRERYSKSSLFCTKEIVIAFVRNNIFFLQFPFTLWVSVYIRTSLHCWIQLH